MLTRFRFRNFKAWKDTGDIRLAPVTVLFGTNSAGKTSIAQLLLLLKQTAESSDRQRALQLGDARTLIDLGAYTDVLHEHDASRPLEVEMEWTLGDRLSVTDPLSASMVSGDRIAFSMSTRADERGQPSVEKLNYDLLSEGSKVLGVGMTPRNGSFDLHAEGYNPARRPGREGPLPAPVRFYGFPDETSAFFQNTAFVSDFVLQMERMLRSIFYVGPLREYPKRLYLWSGEAPEHVGAKGERVIEAILAGGARSYNFKEEQNAKTLPELIAERLAAMGLIYEFQVKPLAENRREYEVLVRTAAGAPLVKLTDVGFGVSQVLPVVVECFYVPSRSIVIFEQPELHLHPNVQSDLADLFVDAIRAREHDAPRDCQFIIECHSEHFLRRLQRRIAEEAITEEDVALYFVDTDQGAARVQALEVDTFGNILNWPDGFFGDEMADLVARAEAQARRAARRSK